MKKFYSIITVYFFFLSGLSAQELITTWDGEIYRNMSLSLKDGSVLTGYGKVILIEFDDFISFKKTKKEGETLYGSEDIIHLKTNIGNSESIFKYKTVTTSPEGEWSKLLETIVEGKIRLYQGYFNTNSTDLKRTYYISKREDEFVKSLKSGAIYASDVQRTIKKYTKGCSSLTKKVTSKHFKASGIRDVVRYYNDNCAN